jgi:hypothetical protein
MKLPRNDIYRDGPLDKKNSNASDQSGIIKCNQLSLRFLPPFFCLEARAEKLLTLRAPFSHQFENEPSLINLTGKMIFLSVGIFDHEKVFAVNDLFQLSGGGLKV